MPPPVPGSSLLYQVSYFVGGRALFPWPGVDWHGEGSKLSYIVLAIPVLSAAASLAILASRVAIAWFLNFWRTRNTVTEPSESPQDYDSDSNLREKFGSYVKNRGGAMDFILLLLRLLGGIILVLLAFKSSHKSTHIIPENLLFEQTDPSNDWRLGPVSVPQTEILDLGFILVYSYTTLLSFVTLFARKRWASIASTHITTIYIITFGVYAYRNLYPLATFHREPQDKVEGFLIWIKIAVLSVVGLLIPSLMRREYIPVDPKNPMAEPNPEQTASILSMITYTFLDSIIFLAYRVPHLSYDQLPPLADYDYASSLKAKSFPHLDLFSGAPKRHIFFGIMKVYRFEYIAMGVLLASMVVVGFLSPIAINRLLNYLETGGSTTSVRPWFWILSLFLGPLLSTLCFQGYIFFATRTLARTEAIITQLVFEHALRIRVKAETAKQTEEESSSPPEISSQDINNVPQSSPNDIAKVNETDIEHSRDATLVNGTSSDMTVQASSASTKSTSSRTSKGKKLPMASEESADAGNLIGRINNLVTTDLGNIVEARDMALVIVYMPLQIVLCVIFLYILLGWSAFVGLGVMILLFPLPGVIIHKMQEVQKIRLQKTDARVQTVTEAMNVLRMIKMFGWEKKMEETIAEKREEELLWQWKRAVYEFVNGNLNFVIPIIVMISTFFTYVRLSPFRLILFLIIHIQTVIMKQELRASIVFSSMTVFDLLREQLFTAFYITNALVSGKVSLDRVNDFLKNTELLDSYSEKSNPLCITPLESQDKIGFNEASFTWSSDTDGTMTPSRRKYMLKVDRELVFKPNRLNLIVGPTGSGKTSMLMALLGEMHYVPSGPNSWFNLPRKDGVAFAAQESWVQNETIRENILFGSPYDEERYRKVIYQCGLERDLQLFDAGDQTEVGEKGLTLSGGQKARVTLARAIYSSAQTILLDDVLAALDVHTAKWIVDKCFSGDLVEGRTVILVTHNIALTRHLASFAVSIGTDGLIVAQGTVAEVLGADKTIAKELEKDEEAIIKAEEKIDQPTDLQSDGKLIVPEEIEEGHVSWKALKSFLVGLGGSHPGLFFFGIVSTLLLEEFLVAFETWYLGLWATQYEHHPPSEVPVAHYLGVYSGLLAFSMTLYAIVYILYIYGTIRASRYLHQKLVNSVLGTTLRWLDITPTSRIITRCTQDIRTVDGPIKDGLKWLSELSATMLAKFCAIVFMTPVFLGPGIIVAVLGGWIGRVYMAAQLSVKREMSNARSPVVGHFGAAIAGLASIRAYAAQDSFIQESMKRINRYTRASRTYYNLNRWVCIRIDTIGGLFAASLGVYLVYFKSHSAANIGFSLNMAVGFSGLILWWIRTLNEFEVQGNSLERIQGYVEIEQEPKSKAQGVPPAYWPASGSLRARNLCARYSPNGPKVLHDISFDVLPGERVGIVGRTGSGKSSLTLALLRCIFTEGEVFYDGIKTDTLNLDILRSNITIIPQIPELLSGTLRHNLDPFDQYDDATLNNALRAAGLFALQADMDEGRITLDTNVSSGGSNLSVGQRQILALARAIVRGSKLLILDEATSAIDHETDTAIQSSLRNELGQDTTVITIAHRLQTIMDADKIMVLDAGRIVEYDSPSNLLDKEDGYLRSLVDESGEKERLFDMATKKSTLVAPESEAAAAGIMDA